MRKLIVCLCVFASLVVLPVSEAQSQKCYVCAPGPDGTKCHEWLEPGFSATLCSLRCYYGITAVCFCRTYGDTCQEPENLEPENLSADEKTGKSSRVAHEARFSIEQKTEQALRAKAGELVTNFLNWPIPKSFKGPGPHTIRGMVSEGAESYAFVGEVTFMYGTTLIEYDLESHPRLDSIVAQFGPGGYDGTVYVYQQNGEVEHHELIE